MPITEDILKHQFIGPAYRRGFEEGRKEGLEEAREKRREAGRRFASRLLRRQIAKRFGPIPAGLDERLSRSSLEELEAIADRVLDAANLEELLP